MTTQTQASPRALKYRADLVRQAVAAGHDELELRAAMTEHDQAAVSEHIKFLNRLLGRAERPPTSHRSRRGYGARRPIYRCTHIDYPCCGCGPDAAR